MARRQGGSGCGWVLLFLGFPLIAVLVGVVAGVVGLTAAGPAIVVYLLVTDPGLVQQYPSWWAVSAAAPVLMLGLVWAVSLRRTHSSARVHLARTGTLLACTTLASLLALFPYEPPADEPGRSALAAAGAAISVTLVGLGVIALLNRKVPLKPGRGRQRTGVVRRVDPYPGEIWWGMVDFRDGDGAKDRPFLIVNVYDGCAVILQITTKDKTHRRDHVRFTTASMDPDGMDRRLEMRPRTVSLSDFRKPHHLACPPRTWRLVQAQFGSRAAS